MEYFTDGFLQLFTEKCQNWLLCGWLGTRHQIQAFQGFYLKLVFIFYQIFIFHQMIALQKL